MKSKFLFIPLTLFSLSLTACPFRLNDGGKWKERFGTPELLLENATDEAYIYLNDDSAFVVDKDNVVKEAMKKAAPFENNDSHSLPKDTRYFTYQAEWVPATTGPNYEYLSIWENGFVRIDHKSSLGPHEYLYFSISEEKAFSLVELVFSLPITEY